MNIVCVSTFKRPFHTRLCLEAICRAQRWSRGWADQINVHIPSNGHEHPDVLTEVLGVVKRNPDVPFWILHGGYESNPHAASKYMLDTAFGSGADMAVYVEDDAVLAVDALLMCECTRRFAGPPLAGETGPAGKVKGVEVLGCCLYHETIPSQYAAEGRVPDRSLLHLSNGLNTCGGTAFLRKPYLDCLSDNWNCKKVEPRGFDYSAHYLMYLHGLYMVWPDLSRSHNIGFTAGSISQTEWAKYFGRSLWTQSEQALVSWNQFKMDGFVPPLMREEWMHGELLLLYRGLL